MFSFLFDVLSSLAHIAWDVISFLAHALVDLVSGIASVFLWPIKAVLSAMSDWWGFSAQWTTLYFLGSGILLVLVILLACWAVAANSRKNYHL